MNKKIIATVGACALCLGLGVAGTLAWLTDKTESVTNTFTTSNVDITLTETTGSNYQMIPGFTITKDPKVTVSAGSEDCYLFVKLEESDNYSAYLENYKISDGWKQLKNGETDVDGVYYREVESNDTSDQPFYVLKNNQLTVKSSVTKADMEAIDDSSDATSEPTLTVKAYATQLYKTNNEKMDVYNAWLEVGE